MLYIYIILALCSTNTILALSIIIVNTQEKHTHIQTVHAEYEYKIFLLMKQEKKKLKWRTITSRIAALTSMLFLRSFVDLLFTGSVLHVVFLNVQAWAQNENILHSFHRITCSLWNFGRRIFDLDLFVIKLDQYCTQYTHKPHTIFWSCHNCFNSTDIVYYILLYFGYQPSVRDQPIISIHFMRMKKHNNAMHLVSIRCIYIKLWAFQKFNFHYNGNYKINILSLVIHRMKFRSIASYQY